MRIITSIFTIAYVTALMIAGPATVESQMISDVVFQRRLNDATAAAEKFSRRVTVVEETKMGDKLIGTNRTVEDFLPPGRQRYLDITSSGGKSSTREIIQLGSVGYSKEDNGPWIEWTGSPWRPRLPKYLPPRFELEEARTFTSFDEILNGQSVRVYVREENRETNGIRIRERFAVWIAQDGLIYKSEFENIEVISEKRVQRTVAIWDYAPKGLSIERPIE